MKSLIVGMGIGQLYKSVLNTLGHEIVTVDRDIAKAADFPNIDAAVFLHGNFDTVHICTPNFTHLALAKSLAKCSKIIFVEKPGVVDEKTWQELIDSFPLTRFIMVKNNMWRENIEDLKTLADKSCHVKLNWINNDRVPSPGSWFTNKALSFGGVSRDLMPHLLSLYIALNPNWQYEIVTGFSKQQRYKLTELSNTEYGIVNSNGTYNVDDICHYSFGDKWSLTADWRSLQKDRRNIEFYMPDNSVETFELGLCPEEAYLSMIRDVVSNLENNNFWKTQQAMDLWIHKKVENL